jgi:hypothetical protein
VQYLRKELAELKPVFLFIDGFCEKFMPFMTFGQTVDRPWVHLLFDQLSKPHLLVFEGVFEKIVPVPDDKDYGDEFTVTRDDGKGGTKAFTYYVQRLRTDGPTHPPTHLTR